MKKTARRCIYHIAAKSTTPNNFQKLAGLPVHPKWFQDPILKMLSLNPEKCMGAEKGRSKFYVWAKKGPKIDFSLNIWKMAV